MRRFEPPSGMAAYRRLDIDIGQGSDSGFLDSRLMLAAIVSLVAVFLILRIVKAPRYSNVATSSGTLVGVRTLTADGVSVGRFLGIPYAQSTAGSRRFTRASPLDKFPGLHWEGLKPGAPCTQWRNGTVVGSEDCLSLSVWAPTSNGPNRTIVIVLTGEWFETGSNSDHDWTELAAAADAVVVSINYRLGVMGFFSPDFSDMVPDAGFEDVLLAVDWVRRNADAFDADPGQLVALGHGSGAYLLALALASRKHHKGFRRALLQGVFPTMPLSRNTAAMTQSYMHRMALTLDCNAADILAELACLKAAPQEQLLGAARQLHLPLRFVPTGLRITDSLSNMNFGDGVKVVLGSDLSRGREFFENYLLPYVTPRQNVSDAEAMLDSVCMFLKERPCLYGNGSRPVAAVGNVSESELEELLPHVWTTCPSRAMAAAATLRHVATYHYVSATSELFDPPFSMQDVAAFVSKGTLPRLKSGLPWPAFQAAGISLSLADGTQELDSEKDNEMCNRTMELQSYLL